MHSGEKSFVEKVLGLRGECNLGDSVGALLLVKSFKRSKFQWIIDRILCDTLLIPNQHLPDYLVSVRISFPFAVVSHGIQAATHLYNIVKFGHQVIS